VTPQTGKRTAAEKDCCPNAGAIIDRVFFDIKNRSALHKWNIPLARWAVNGICRALSLLKVPRQSNRINLNQAKIDVSSSAWLSFHC
jgi:hypothetical protein